MKNNVYVKSGYITCLYIQVIESCVLGIRKPDPRIFYACLKELDLQPEETVFLDDLRKYPKLCIISLYIIYREIMHKLGYFLWSTSFCHNI